jgi:hypothetical protein
VRDIVKEHGSHILDLESDFNSMESEDLQKVFSRDGIHFTPFGLALVAGRISNFIGANVLRSLPQHGSEIKKDSRFR